MLIYKNKLDIISAENDIKESLRENKEFIAKMNYLLKDFGFYDSKDFDLKSIIDFDLIRTLK